jgi:hypothetical protein
MKAYRLWPLLGLLPVAILFAVTLGCGGGNTPSASSGGDVGTSQKAATTGGELKELASTGWGTLKGKVTLAGEKPNLEELNTKFKAKIDKDQTVCLAADAPDEQKTQQEWRISKDGGVGNVVVWLRPADGTYFKKHDADPAWAPKDPAKIDQPHCAFIPHVQTMFPAYFDPKEPGKEHRTGQELVVVNSAPIAHNTKWDGGTKNPGGNETLQSKGEKKIPGLKPNYNQPIAINCDIHKWMSGYVWAFEHPYAAVTKEDGTYEIKNVPAGVELKVVAWHEVPTFITKGKAKGDPIKVEADKETVKDFTVEAK